MKYKVGDKVRIKSLDWYNKNKDVDGIIDCGVLEFDEELSVFCGRIVTINTLASTNDYDKDCYTIIEDNKMFNWTDEMIEGLVEDETTNVMNENKMLIGWIKEPNRYRLVPDKDYEIKYDEKGFFYLEKKKKEYPKTFEECVHVLEGENRMSLEQMNTFRKLVDARNAYWKLYGEEMGLGKPWEPDLLDDIQDKFILANWDDNIEKHDYITNRNYILTFPTAKMRDAFYENFKELIEQCKELL